MPYKMIAGINGQWVFYYIFKRLLFVVIGVFTAPFTCLWAVYRVIRAFR
ncbi:permease of the drug/metabolite transporter [Tannerella forsythia]|nr:permease of the drug/metabolite transporter [Tannerella forsythia]TPE18385.1 permease of the drug/metabolite transporter [Tannerella forsythia]